MGGNGWGVVCFLLEERSSLAGSLNFTKCFRSLDVFAARQQLRSGRMRCECSGLPFALSVLMYL